MRKRLAITVLSLVMVFSFGSPGARAASGGSAGAAATVTSGGGSGNSAQVPAPGAITSAEAIAAVTKYFTPPKGATVNAEYVANQFVGGNQHPTWMVNWFVPFSVPAGGGEAEGMFAGVDAMTGRILNFNRQHGAGTPSPGPSGKTYTYQEALAEARQVMGELAPEAAGHVRLETGSNSSSPFFGLYQTGDYRFDFVRLENGLPVWGGRVPQGVDIAVNVNTGEVDSYSFNWQTDVGFPSPTPVLDVTRATYDWWGAGGLELAYDYSLPAAMVSGPGGPNEVRLAYVMKAGGLYVDADSGGIIDSSGAPYQAGSSDAIPAATVARSSPPPGGLPDSAAAVAWAQKILPIHDGYKLATVGQGQMTGPDGQTLPQWNLSWQSGEQGPGVNATFSDSGRLLNYGVFSSGSPASGTAAAEKLAVSRAQALQKAVDFVTGAAGIDLSAGYRLENQPAYMDFAGDQGYGFSFTPTSNGIPFNEGGMYVRVSSATGQVLSFGATPFLAPAKLPSAQGLIGMDKARALFSQNVTLQLGYLIPAPAPGSQTAGSAVLVYGVPSRFAGAVIDAVSGEMTDRMGNNLLISGAPSDVAGSWAAGSIEQALQRHLMSVDAQGLFRPQNPVTRGEAVEMLLRAASGYSFISFPSPGPADFADVPVGSAYYPAVEEAYHLGLVAKAAAFRPDDPVTREEFAVMAVRALKYDAIGRMTLAIPLPYKDAAAVNRLDANYVAVATGLGLFRAGGDFRPLDPLTRAEAATVLVRLPSPR